MENFQDKLEKQYQKIRQSGLDCLFIHPGDIYPLIDQLINDCNENDDFFQIKQVGSSFLKKPIYKITVGTGPVNILLWSQMHGNEPTATASLFDLINYTMAAENQEWFDNWRDKLTLHIVPMLNPDGAELEQRVNAQGIDINRDAKALQSPEGKLLLSLAEEIKPHFGFNLHNQSRFYSVGQTGKSAIISLLAPANNDSDETNESRKKAKQIVAVINHAVTERYSNHVGRYDDTYSSRSFGDLFSSKGISTILIESGYHKSDRHRQIPRWLNFLSLVVSINAIRNQTYVNESLNNYSALPINTENGLVDVLLKNITMDGGYQIDISINYDDNFSNGLVDAIGDLSTVAGFKTIDMQHFQIQAMRCFQLSEPLTLSTKMYINLLSEGYGYFQGDESLLKIDTTYPVVVNPQNINNWAQLNQPANFLFSIKGEVSLAIVEGAIIELDTIACT